MKKFIAILLIISILLTSFSVMAQSEDGYTHLPISAAGNSKLFLLKGNIDTNYTKYVDYYGRAGTVDLEEGADYASRALKYSYNQADKNSTVLYLNDNIWTLGGIDYRLEPESKIIKLIKYKNINISDAELVKQIRDLETAEVDIQDGYYKTINILASVDSDCTIKVTLHYEDGTEETKDIQMYKMPFTETTQESGYIVLRNPDGLDQQNGQRFYGYTIECNESKAVTSITYTATSTWRHIYIISQMAENVPFSVIKERGEGFIAGMSDNPDLTSVINYIKAKNIINIMPHQYGKEASDLANYQRFLSLEEKYEDRLTDDSAFDIYVANTAINGDGSFDRPFNNIESARDFIEDAFNRDVLKTPVNVNIRGGEYYLDESVIFTENNSGKKGAEVTYKAYNNEEVVFTTAEKIDISQFEPVKDKNVLNTIGTKASGYVLQADLNKLGIENPGQFLPNADVQVVEDAILVSDDRQLPTAQYPNGDMNMTMGVSVIDPGQKRLETFERTGGGTIEITPKQAEKWQYLKPMESYIQGAFYEPWMFERLLIEEVSAENNSMKFSTGSYGPIEMSNWGGLRYKIMHALCELDTPGEWYIDRVNNILYYYPFSDDKEIYISTESFDAFKFSGVSFVNFEGISFKNIRGNAIYAEKGFNDVKIDGCTFKNIAGSAIWVVEQKDSKAVGYNVNSSYNLNIENNMFISIGNYALRNNGSGHSGTLTYSGNTFSNNYLYDCSNLAKKYMVSISNAVADKFENNLLHKSEMGGLTFTGNDMFVGYNEVYNMGQNAADVAGIYTGRSYVRTNNEIAYNYVHNSKPLFPQLINHHRGIYLDDGTSGQYVHHNFANNVTYMSSASGKKNRILNNIILGESKTPISLGVSTYLTDSQMLNPLEKARNMDNYGEVWLKKYPWLADIDKWTDYNNEVRGNITQLPVHYGEEWAEFNNVEEDIKDNITLGVGNYEPFVNPENHDFRVKKDSDILNTNPDIMNENNFSMESIGLQGNIVSKIQSQLNQENSQFDIIMPKRNSNISQTHRVFFMWQIADHADEYDFKLYKATDLSNPLYEATTGTNFVELNDFPFENEEYKWTVTAKVDSLKIRAEWDSKVKYNSFKVTDIVVNEDVYEYIDLRPYNNAVCFVTVGQSANRMENGRYVFSHDFALNLQKFKSQLDERNMVKAGDIYYKINQLDDKYKGILNFHEEIVIDIPDGKYEAIYLLGSLRCSNLIKKNIKVKYSDGTEETLSLGQQVHYDAENNTAVSGAILPQVYTGAVWVKKAEIRGDWFGAGAYSHQVKPSENKTITSIIIPKIDVVTEAFDIYAITLKLKTDNYEIKNITSKDIKTSIIEEFDEQYRISDLEIKANSSLYGLDKNAQETRKVFFWNIDNLYPYSNILIK